MDAYKQTAELLEKLYLPVGEVKDIEIDLGEKKLVFKAKVLSSAEMSKLRRKHFSIDLGDPEKLVEATERFNAELIQKVILEPKVEFDRLPEPLREILLEEIYKLHGYGSKEIIKLLEKKLGMKLSGMI